MEKKLHKEHILFIGMNGFPEEGTPLSVTADLDVKQHYIG
jgi:hypothetical protein